MRQYTIADLLNADRTRLAKAAQCVVEFEKTYHELKSETLSDKIKALFGGKNLLRAYYVIFKLKVTSDTGKVHTVFIRTNPDFNLTNYYNNKVQIYCDCDDFKYRSAYHLKTKNSLFLNDRIKIALGAAINDAPKSKTATSILCKHALAALNWLVENYTSVMGLV